jgi:hypothetical protein
MPGAPYYAQGGPRHCPQPLVWRRIFRARDGRRYIVEACEGHWPPAVSPQPAPGSLNGHARGGQVTLTLILLGLAGLFAGFVLTVLARAKKVGDSWEDRGLWAIFGGFALVMAGVALAVATAG